MARKYLTTPELEAIANASDFFDFFDIDDENVSENENQVLEDIPSDDESSNSSDSAEDDGNTGDTLQARDGTIWSKIKPRLSRRPSRNILCEKPGRTAYGENFTTAAEAFHLFMSDEIVDVVIQETNRRAYTILGDDWKPVDKVEINAFFGLLILAGSFKANHEPILELWSTKYPSFQRPIFCATMSRNRMKSLLRFIRFDDLATRPERREVDKLAAIRYIHDTFASNCKKSYTPNAGVCIDEQLVPFRGRCPFRVYIKSKPDKYGVKVWALCDSTNSYCWNLQVYTGMTNNTPEKEQGININILTSR